MLRRMFRRMAGPLLGLTAAASVLAACDEPGSVRPDVGFIANAAPDAVDDTLTAMSGAVSVIDVVANDTDPDGDPLFVLEFAQPDVGELSRGDARRLIYRAPQDYVGPGRFTYVLSDGRDGRDTATVTIEVTGVNAPPVAGVDEAATQQGQPVELMPLANDRDPDGDPLSLESVSTPANGMVAEPAPGQVRYTPNAGFFGVESFTYRVGDGRGLSSTGTIRVNVNGRPLARPDRLPAPAGATTELDVLANDGDPDGDPIELTAVTAAPTSGMAVVRAGRVVYTPNQGFVGLDAFTYSVTDARGGTATATVGVNVSNPPVPGTDEVFVQQGETSFIDVLANDTDPEGDRLTVVQVGDPRGGTASLEPDGTIRYVPFPSFSGLDAFTYVVDDGNLNQAEGTVNVEVNGRPIARDDSVFTPVDVAVNVPVLANDTDPDGDTLGVQMVAPPSDGTASINMDGTVRYVPSAGFRGAVRFGYTVGDGRGGVNTGRLEVVVNGLPVAVDDTILTQQDTDIDIPVLANDTDPDNNALQVSQVTQGANGQVTVNGDGTVRYSPRLGFFGRDTFEYVVDDGRTGNDRGQVTVNVNSRPIANDDTASTQTATPVNIPVLANDTDAEMDALTVVSVTRVNTGTVAVIEAGARVRFVPNSNFSGTDRFRYTLRDARGGTATATVTVSVNSVTVARPDTAVTQVGIPVNIDVLFNDVDPDGDPLTVTSAGPARSGQVTVNFDNSVRYVPNAGFNGLDSFDYSISDGRGETATASVSVRVNAAPNAVADVLTVLQDAPARLDVLRNDSDPDRNPLRIQSVTMPGRGTATSTAGDVILYTPAPGFFGPDSLVYVVEDGFGGTNQANVTIAVNGRPTANDDAIIGQRNATVDVPVLANDTDPENDMLSIVEVTPGLSGTTTIVGQSVRYAPQAGFFGLDFFTYTLSDGRGGTATAQVTVDVNAPPEVVDDVAVVLGDTPADIDVLFNDISPDLDPLTLDSVTRGTNGDVAVNPNNTLRYTPGAGFTGGDTFTYTLRDGRGGVATGRVNVTIVRRPLLDRRTDALTGVADSFGVAVGEINGDGLIDAVATNRLQGTVTVVLNQTLNDANQAAFGARFAFPVGPGPEAVALIDMNRDGLLDIVSANADAGTITVLVNTTPINNVQPTFAAGVDVMAGTSPRALAFGDFNGDQIVDVAVANGGANTVTVLLNTTPAASRAIAFQAPTPFAATAASGVVATDVNRDGRLDLVATNSGARTVTVLLNQTANGATTPSFAAGVPITAGDGPLAIAAGDLNGDNAPDLVTANPNDNTCSILFNTTPASGTTPSFAAATVISTGADPVSITLVDVNRDGRLDVVTSNNGEATLSVLFNQTAAMATTPAFTANQTVATGPGPWTVTSTDLNGNLIPDLVVVEAAGELVTGLANRTAVGATTPTIGGIGSARIGRSTPIDVELADMTRDGVVDAITLDRLDRTVSIFGNDTAPLAQRISFAARSTWDMGIDPVDLAVADLNADGRADVAVLNQAATLVTVRLNTTAAAGTAATLGDRSTVVTGARPTRIALADVNNDNRPDLVVTNQGNDRVAVYANNTTAGATTPSFGAAVNFTTGLAPSSVTVADVNGDGRRDLLVTNANQNSVSVLINTTAGVGAPTFAPHVTFAVGAGPTAVIAADLNGDGRVDLATTNAGDGSISVLASTTPAGNPNPTFLDAVNFVGTAPGSTLPRMTASDVNGDGRVDLVIATDGDGSGSVLYNLTVANTTLFAFEGVSYATGAGAASAAVGDLNGDANADLLVCNAEVDSLTALAGP